MFTFELRESSLKILKKYLNDKELLNIFNNRIVKKTTQKHHEYQDEKFKVTLTIKELEKLLDFLSNILMEYGFDENDNLTSIGNNIENLIDLFNYYDKA